MIARIPPLVARLTRVSSAGQFLAPLLTRLVIGLMFYFTGRGKLAHFDRTVEFFGTLGIPFPELNAAFVARLEYYGGLLLILGLATRLVAAGLASTMVVALMTADRERLVEALSLTSDVGLTDVAPLPPLLFLLWLVFYGPGILSLDGAIAGAFPKAPAPVPDARNDDDDDDLLDDEDRD